jgi:hypothetical protein
MNKSTVFTIIGLTLGVVIICLTAAGTLQILQPTGLTGDSLSQQMENLKGRIEHANVTEARLLLAQVEQLKLQELNLQYLEDL